MLFPTVEWRLLLDSPAEGAWNMAVDEAILDGVLAGTSPPTLRLYAWAPACLSLGYGQSAADVDWQALETLGWMAVRRPTGGRAILHTDELTYSVTGLGRDPRLDGGIIKSYQQLAGGLLCALGNLSLSAASQSTSAGPAIGDGGPVCFEVPSNWEITVSGKKLIGSAQMRRKGGVLQHGALPLFGDLTRITRVLAYSSDTERRSAAERLLLHATSVERTLGRPVAWEAAADAFRTGFADALQINFISGELSSEEDAHAHRLMEEKYGSALWTKRR